ncbi:hypothetical protein F4824DRAFT_483448 [Ustulina deusta]|nr:hypothetical protein F4824DRAFT_483448 [Ustulina deusta]
MAFLARNSGRLAVCFEADGQGIIVYHKPRSEPNFSPVMLQVMRARMSQCFG